MASGPPDKPGKGPLQRIAEVLSVLTASAFLVSALINSAIFLGWGVVFLSVATPTDVVMSGLQLLLYALALLAYVALFVSVLLPNAEDTRRGRRAKTFLIKAGIVASGGAVVFFGAGVAYGIGPKLPLAQAFQVMSGCALTFIVFLVMNEVPADGPKRNLYAIARDHWSGAQPIALLSGGSLLFGGMFVASGAVLLASTIAIVGFVPQQTWYDGPGDGGCAPLHVLWIGQSSVLAECPADKQVRVLSRGGTGVVLRVSDHRPPAYAASTKE